MTNSTRTSQDDEQRLKQKLLAKKQCKTSPSSSPSPHDDDKDRHSRSSSKSLHRRSRSKSKSHSRSRSRTRSLSHSRSRDNGPRGRGRARYHERYHDAPAAMYPRERDRERDSYSYHDSYHDPYDAYGRRRMPPVEPSPYGRDRYPNDYRSRSRHEDMGRYPMYEEDRLRRDREDRVRGDRYSSYDYEVNRDRMHYRDSYPPPSSSSMRDQRDTYAYSSNDRRSREKDVSHTSRRYHYDDDKEERRKKGLRSRRSRSNSRSIAREDSSHEKKSKTKSKDTASKKESNSMEYSSSSSSVASAVDPDKLETMSSFEEVEEESSSTKEERTIFLTQLIQRTTVRDVRHYFHSILRLPIVEDSVIFLQHGNTGRHRGMAYVTLKYRRDVPRALEYSNRVPDWQRFPIQIRLCGITTSAASVVTSADGGMSTTGSTNTASNAANHNPTIGIANSSNIQQVYVGNLERVVTSEQVEYLFSQFGTVSKVSLQVDALTNVSKGFAFVSYAGDSTAKDANLAIQTMQGQLLAGRPMKTGWATVHSADAETSMEFPEDAAVKVQKANVALQQLSGNGLSALASLGIIEDHTSTAIDTATGTDDVTHTNTTNSAPLTKVVQIEHMYDPSIDDIQDETTYKELVEELREELMRLHPDLIIQEIICYNIDHTTITSSSNDNTNNKRVGCMKVALETEEMAMRCLQSLQGRFFDGRKLQVTYV